MAQQNDTQADDLETGGGLSVSDAASRIEGLLSDEDLGITAVSSAAKSRKPKPSKPADDDDAEEREVDDDEDDEEGGAEVDDEDDEEDDVDSEDDEDDEEDEEDDDDDSAPQNSHIDPKAKVKVKVDGEDEEVTLGEALAGYSRTASFTKKSQKLADERKAHEAELAAQRTEIQAAQAHYVSQLSALESALSTQEPDWDAVRRDNPEQFAELHAAWRIHQDRIAAIRAERQAEQAKLSQKERDNLAETVKTERAKLIEKVPVWGDATDKGKAVRKAVRDFGLSHGFTEAELDGVTDHRAFVLLHKAYLFDKSQADKKAKTEKGKKKVEALQTVRPGTKQGRKAGSKTKAARAAARLKRTGNVRDAAAAIEAMLD